MFVISSSDYFTTESTETHETAFTLPVYLNK